VNLQRGHELVGLLSGQLEPAHAESVSVELLGEFFGGYPIERLRPLLGSDVATAVRAGAWIASELGARAAPLRDDLVALLGHPLRYVRFFAIDAILASASADDSRATAALAKAIDLIEDPDSAVRWKVMQLLTRADDRSIAANSSHIRSPAVRELIEWLAGRPDQTDISTRLDHDDATTRLVAAAAAARQAEIDDAALRRATASPDEEVASFAREQVEFAALRRRP
jgi:hypothetical protein